MKIKAVVFDIDGTLYPYESMYLKSIPVFIKYFRFISNFGKVRSEIRKKPCEDIDFRIRQAKMLAARLGVTDDYAYTAIESIIYDKWINSLKGIRPYRNVEAVLDYLKKKRVKLAVLSDFPAAEKLEFLGLQGYWDTVLCSEESGNLKPDTEPFLIVCKRLGIPADQVLFVGDNPRYDIIGAIRAGMKTALFSGILAGLDRFKSRYSKTEPDFRFTGYAAFLQILLKIIDN